MSRPRVLVWSRFSKTQDTILDHKGLFAITRNDTGTSFSLHVSTELGGPGLNRRAVERYESILAAKDSAARGLYPKDKFTAPVPRVKRKYTRRVIEAPAPAPATTKRAKATKATKAAPVPAKRAKKVAEAPAPVPAPKRTRAKKEAAVAIEAAPTPAPAPKRTRAKASKPPVAVANDTAPAPETESAAA